MTKKIIDMSQFFILFVTVKNATLSEIFKEKIQHEIFTGHGKTIKFHNENKKMRKNHFLSDKKCNI